MQTPLRLLLLLMLSPLCAASTVPEVEIAMSVLPRSQVRYETFLSEQLKSVFEVSSFKSQHANSNVVSMVVILQALKLGGISPKLVLLEAPNYGREIQMVKSGAVVVVHQDTWGADFDDSVYKSADFIPNGRYFLGLYVKESNRDKFKISSIQDFKNYSSVSSPAWSSVWTTLKQLNLKTLHATTDRTQMFNVVLFRDVDFTALGFSLSEDMAFEAGQGRLVPLPGIKLAVNDTRNFMVSKKHKDGERVFAALQKGLAILQANGTIDRYLTEAGFYNLARKDWKIIDVTKAQQ